MYIDFKLAAVIVSILSTIVLIVWKFAKIDSKVNRNTEKINDCKTELKSLPTLTAVELVVKKAVTDSISKIFRELNQYYVRKDSIKKED